MSKKSKFFRVAREGATTDGRVISRDDIQLMASGYNPAVYGARVWLEHIRGVLPDGPFQAYGDVASLRAEQEGGVYYLLAEIEPTPALVKMNKDRQKIYSSIEMSPKFADTGKPYFVGLGVTDSPASLGTDKLTFSAQNPTKSPFAALKQSPENLFSAAEETVIEFESDENEDGNKPSLFTRIKELLGVRDRNDQQRYADVSASVELIAKATTDLENSFTTQLSELKKSVSDGVAALSESKGQFAALQTEFHEFKTALEKADPAPKRPPATGGPGTVKTDC